MGKNNRRIPYYLSIGPICAYNSGMNPIKANQRFGYLTTIESRRRNDHTEWKCVCICGKEKWIVYSLLKGAVRPVKSCGCKRIYLLRKARLEHGASLRDSRLFPTFITWQSMLWRCYNKERKDYPRYGGRGISVCEDWKSSFENFLKYMGKKPKGMSLGRIDNEDSYKPSNCRWETTQQQARNKSSNRLLNFKGQDRTLVECSELTGIKRSTISQRIEAGWSVSDALTKQVRGAINYG